MTDLQFAVLIALALCSFTPLIGVPPFTGLFARRMSPRAVRRTRGYRLTNELLSYFWGLLFGLTALLVRGVSDGGALQQLLPWGFLAVAGGCGTAWGIRSLPQYIRESYKPSTCRELLELMPHGLNRRYARRLDRHTVLQLSLTGKETIRCYLDIRRNRCTCHYGTAECWTTFVSCDSELWLSIANGETSPVRASLDKRVTVEGDATIMLHLPALFRHGLRAGHPFTRTVDPKLYEEYERLPSADIRKVVIFYSGVRTEEFSKTLFLAESFAEGVRAAGKEAESVYLSRKRIGDCRGCYCCWTSTPGRCVIRDDMAELSEKYLRADMCVFASPLYIFSVNGVMKRFMDRLLPLLSPYMLPSRGLTLHPDRYPRCGPRQIVVVSAGGFPHVAHNFDGLRALFAARTRHSQTEILRGELLLPAAETLFLPEFADRRERVRDACRQLGFEAATSGRLSARLMRQISDPGISQERFREMADIFWELLDGKKPYMQAATRLRKETS